jgi:hypothetical protein
MSMTQIAFLQKSMLPKKADLESAIYGLGYSFEFLDEFDNFEGLEGLKCKIKGNETYVEMDQDLAANVLEDYPSFKDRIGDADYAVYFFWGADIAAAAAIAVLSLALIDTCKAVIIYADDDMLYTREMLITDIPAYLLEL